MFTCTPKLSKLPFGFRAQEVLSLKPALSSKPNPFFDLSLRNYPLNSSFNSIDSNFRLDR